MRCYNDSLIGKFKAYNFSGSCDTTYVGIKETILNQTTSIFPNPTFDKIKIETENNIDKIEIYSVSGQKLLATKNKEIDLSSFSKGIYLLKIHFETGIIYRKIIKE